MSETEEKEISLKELLNTLNISRQAFSKANKKHKTFKKSRRGVYFITDEKLNLFKSYYVIKKTVRIWK